MNDFYTLLTNNYDGVIDPPTKEGDQEPVIQDINKGPEQVKVNINISNTKPSEQMLAMADLAHDDIYRKKLHDFITQEYPIIDGKVAMEGLIPWIKNVFTAILNSLGRIINLFKTAAFAGWRSFKRSELTEYVDSNMATCGRIFKLNTKDIASISLDIPKGMKGNYENALTAIERTIGETCMLHRAARMYARICVIHQDVISEESEFNSLLSPSNKEATNVRNIEDAIAKENAVFTNSKKSFDTFANLYGDTASLKSIVERTIKFDKEFQQVASIEDYLSEIESEVAAISDHPNVKNLSKENLNRLADMIKDIGYAFEMYSVAMSDLFRVNHNITLNLMTLRSAIK